ncbi:alpha/beta hydrolase [Sulfuritalea sp.]|uniref:alpha/beta hydrolase n=1 Tax=Sulfuritalea sp. TaxID=2480090 RepID=UPI001AD04F70|nr:alpha/beta hydrolase [Sulfuritalea sp.]MBN8477240.1 alpha/beta hydrolase [Sulfuritalea sp.]
MLWSAIQIGLLAYAGLAALIYFKQDALVFQAAMDRGFQATPASIGLRFDSLTLATDDGEKLDGWHVPAGTGMPARGLMIVFHGNAGNIGHRLDYLRMFHDLGYASLILDYRGYGRSSGKPSEHGTYLDAAAAWRHATQGLGYPAAKIVLFGESMGGAVAARLATVQKPAALVLASTFTSVPDLGAGIYPWLPVRLLARIGYDTRERLATIAAPVLVIHSRGDDIIPFAHGEQLFAAAKPPKKFLEIEGGHNEGFVFNREAWVRGLDDFLRSALEPKAAQTPAAAVQ